MNAINHVAIGMMVVAISLLVYSEIALAALQPANATAPNSQVSIIDGVIPSGPVVVNNNANWYTFEFEYTMQVIEDCCPLDQVWAFNTECWEDDTFSDDYVGLIERQLIECNDTMTYSPPAGFSKSWQGTYMHNQCGTGSDWEMEYWYDSHSVCGQDVNTDPPGWQRDQPNQ